MVGGKQPADPERPVITTLVECGEVTVDGAIRSLDRVCAGARLIIWGRFDRMCVFEIGIAALNHIEDSRLVVLNNCGHWAPFEKPEEYTSHVLNFLENI